MILLIVYILSLLPCWYSLVKSFELSFIHHLNKAFFSYFRDILCVNEKVFKALWWWKRYASTTDITWQHLLTIKGIFISIRYDSSFNNTMIFNIHFLVCMFSNCLHKMHNHVHHHSRKNIICPAKQLWSWKMLLLTFQYPWLLYGEVHIQWPDVTAVNCGHSKLEVSVRVMHPSSLILPLVVLVF